MSHVIVYDRQVLVTPWGYSFIVLHGDNNLYESGRRGTEKRVRSWNCWALNMTPDEIREYFLGWCSDAFQEHFKAYGLKGWEEVRAKNNYRHGEHFRISGRYEFVDDAALMRWVEAGLKSARTIEDFVESGHTILAHIEYWPTDDSWLRRTEESWIRADDEFAEWVKNAEKAKADLEEQNVNHIYTILGFSQNEPLKLPRKNQKEIEGPVVVKFGRWYLAEARGSDSYTISVKFEDAKVFPSYAEAKAATDGIRSTKGTRNILSYEQQARAQAKKKYVIEFQWPSGRKEYVIKKVKNGWRHYPDINRAIRYDKSTAEKMLTRTACISDKTITASIVEVVP